MLLLGVTQQSEMRRHLNIFVAENFPDVSELDFSFYPSDQALSSLMYQSMILHRQTHIDQEAHKVQVGIDAKLGYRVGFKYVTIMCICHV